MNLPKTIRKVNFQNPVLKNPSAMDKGSPMNGIHEKKANQTPYF